MVYIAQTFMCMLLSVHRCEKLIMLTKSKKKVWFNQKPLQSGTQTLGGPFHTPSGDLSSIVVKRFWHYGYNNKHSRQDVDV